MEGQISSFTAAPFRIVPASEVLKTLENNLRDLKEFTCFDSDWNLIFLNEFRWNLEKCQSDFINHQEELFKRTFYKPNPYVIQDVVGKCNICL